MEGWIKIYRKMLDWEWYRDANTMRLFLHLLLTANTKEGYWQGTQIKRGQVATSLSSLANELGMSVQNVRTSLAKLKLTSNLTSESTNKLTVITICKFEDYQDAQQADQQATQHANQQQTNNKQEDKNNIYPPSLSKERVSPLTGGATLQERQRTFYNSLLPFLNKYDKQMLRDFYDYWSEPDRSTKPKMRWEKEKTWSLERRLDRWKRMDEEKASKRTQQQSKPTKLDQYREVAKRLGIFQDNDTDQINSIDEQ